MTTIQEKQSRLLELLKQFDEFTKLNNIKYFVASGTCLGAIREKGFIPWDADIDVLMPFEMYKKCERILLNAKFKNIKWLSYKNEKEAPNLMGRIYEDNANIDNLEEYPYIDLFALVGMPSDNCLQEKIMKRSLRNYRIYWIKKRKYKNSLSRRKSQIGFIIQKLLFFYPLSSCIKEFETDLELYPYNDSTYIAPLTGLYGAKEVVPKKWFDDEPIYVQFCDMKVPVTPYVNEYLTHQYGKNYMTPVQFNRYK